METKDSIWSMISDGLADTLQRLHNNFPGGVQGFVALSVISVLTMRYIHNFICTNKTKRKIRERQALARANIATTCQRLEDYREAIDVSITDLPFPELQAKLQSGQLKCSQVLLAYQSKALELHDKLNCVTGFLHDAEERANKLDCLQPQERGALHGIPISLKETVGVMGQDSTSGLSHFIGKANDDYGVLVKAIVKQGAIPFVRTNICQGLISYSCSNPIYGESRHPLKPDRTCGGSSGGEGALLGGNGSILGIGCDMGGSIRVPGHFCGTCGMKPSSGRLSIAGNLPIGYGIVLPLEPEMYQLDPFIPPLPWRDEIFNSKRPLKIGYYTCDGGIEPVPAVRRAVLMAKSCLEKMGHEFVEFTPPDMLHGIVHFGISVLTADNGKSYDELLKHEVIDSCIAGTVKLQSIPFAIKKLMSKLFFFLHPVERAMMAPTKCGDVYNWWKKNEEREDFRWKFVSAMRREGIDAILCPAFPVPAWPVGDDASSVGCGTYPFLYNILDFPCGNVPVTQVNEEDIKNLASYPKRFVIDNFVHRISQGSSGLPIGVQIAGLPFQEEIVLRLLKEIEQGLQEKKEV